MNLGKVAGVFYILIMGMVLGVIAAFLEFLYKARLEARKIEVTSCLMILSVVFGKTFTVFRKIGCYQRMKKMKTSSNMEKISNIALRLFDFAKAYAVKSDARTGQISYPKISCMLPGEG